MAAFTARASLRTACYQLLTGFKTASGLLQQVEKAKPGAYHVPLGFVGAIREREIARDPGTRVRTPVADVFLVFGPSDNLEVANAQDAAVDAFIAYCDLHLDQADPATLLELTETEDVDLPVKGPTGELAYIATRCRLRLSVQEGWP